MAVHWTEYPERIETFGDLLSILETLDRHDREDGFTAESFENESDTSAYTVDPLPVGYRFNPRLDQMPGLERLLDRFDIDGHDTQTLNQFRELRKRAVNALKSNRAAVDAMTFTAVADALDAADKDHASTSAGATVPTPGLFLNEPPDPSTAANARARCVATGQPVNAHDRIAPAGSESIAASELRARQLIVRSAVPGAPHRTAVAEQALAGEMARSADDPATRIRQEHEARLARLSPKTGNETVGDSGSERSSALGLHELMLRTAEYDQQLLTQEAQRLGTAARNSLVELIREAVQNSSPDEQSGGAPSADPPAEPARSRPAQLGGTMSNDPPSPFTVPEPEWHFVDAPIPGRNGEQLVWTIGELLRQLSLFAKGYAEFSAWASHPAWYEARQGAVGRDANVSAARETFNAVKDFDQLRTQIRLRFNAELTIGSVNGLVGDLIRSAGGALTIAQVERLEIGEALARLNSTGSGTGTTKESGRKPVSGKKRLGRSRVDPVFDNRVWEAWSTGRYADYAALAKELKCKKQDVRKAIDRVRKRPTSG